MTGDFVIEVLRNDLITARAAGGKVLLTPRDRVKPEHRALVAKHKADVLQALMRWPDATAPARHLHHEAPRRDELGRGVRWPQVLTGRRRKP